MLTHRLPYPPDKGDRIRSFYWLRALADRHEVDLLTLADASVSAAHVQALEGWARRVHVVPLSRRDWAARLAGAFLTGKSLTEGFFGSREFARKLAELQAGGEYDLCLAVCSSTGAYVLKGTQPKRLIVDLVDVDSVKWRKYSEKHSGLGKWIYRRESVKVARLERRLAEAAECCVTVSDRECGHLAGVSPEGRTLAIPNGVDTEYFRPAGPVGAIDRLVFVGQMDYFPNVEAVRWFAGQVWLKLHQRRPQLQWDIVGRNPAPAVRELAKLANVNVTGEVEDIRPYLRSAVAIAPIDLSCGVQNKVLEAMAAGCPVVASPAVAGGLTDRARKAILVARTPEKWQSAIEMLMTQLPMAIRLGMEGRRVMAEDLTWQRVGQTMLRCVEDAIPASELFTDKENLCVGQIISDS